MDYSYDGIKEELKTKLSLLSNWNKTLYFGVYERLIDAVAYITRKLVYIAEFLYVEANWTTATKRKSLVTLGKLLDYEPYRKIGAYGYVQVIADSTFEASYPYTYTGENVTIPKWATFTDDNSEVNIYCTESTTYYKGQVSTLDVPVKEGIPKSYVYTAEGSASEIITLASDSIDNDEIEVFIVDGNSNILFDVTITSELYFISDLDNYYCEIYNSDDFEKVYIEFGDGISVKKLTSGEKVLIKYAETTGVDGDITSADIITTIVTPLVDSYGTSVTLYVTNEEEIADGSNIEGIESIRENAPNLFAAGYRAGSANDWASIIDAISYIYKSKVWSIDDVGGSTLLSEQNTVYVTAITTSGDDVTTAQQEDIEDNYIVDKKSPTELIEWEDLEKIYLLFDVTAKIENSTISNVTTTIKDTLTENYGTLNSNFQIDVHKSNYMRIIDSLTNIIWHETDLYHLEQELSFLVSDHEILVSKLNTETSVAEDQIYLVDNSTQLWIQRKVGGEWLTPVKIGEASSGVIQATSVGQSEASISGEVLTHTSEEISDTLEYTQVKPESTSIYDAGRLLSYTERNNTDGTGVFVGDDIDPTGTNTIDYETGEIDITLDFTPSGTITANYTQFKPFTVSGSESADTNIISYTVTELLNDSISGVIYGEINPTSTEDDGYILSIAYQTKDGNEEQLNSVRLPRLNQITDIDEDYIFTDLNY